MAIEESKKRNFINISSSDESESSPSRSDDDAIEEISSSTSSDEDDESGLDDSDNEEELEDLIDEEEEFDDNHVDKDDEESMCNRVIHFIRGGSDLNELKTVEYKAYLRSHGLRLSGTKQECIERILEHWRLKDGNGEAFYPRASFTIDCTGDVCKGDVVLFNQKVYGNFDKMARTGRHLGRRTVAGRIVKESYGAAKQQHTFTVEVLWCRGTKKLAPLYPLLVKGRNLYKLKTLRQHWKNEKERSEVLAEKHERGAVARTIREMRKTKAAAKINKSKTYIGPSGTIGRSHAKKNRENIYGKALAKDKKRSRPQNFSSYKISSSKRNRGLTCPVSQKRHQNRIQSNQI